MEAQSKGTFLIRTLVAAGMVFVGGLAVPPAQAQWVVTDPGNTMQAVYQLYRQVEEMSNTYQRWSQTISHYQQQISNVQMAAGSISSLIDGDMSFLMDDTFRLSPVPEDFGVAEKCGGNTAQGVKAKIAGIFSVPNTDESYLQLVERQRDICTIVRILENRKLNTYVRLINEMNPRVDAKYRQLLQRYNALSGAGISQGDQQQLSNEISSADAEMRRGMEKIDQMGSQYDQYISSLKVHQQIISEMMLRGKPSSAVGAVMRTASLAALLGVSPDDLVP